LTATTAALCLLLGVLLGIKAAGGHPRDVLNPFTGVQAAQANNRSAVPARPPHTVTVTMATAQAAKTVTVSAPPKTVTETVTVTDTVDTTTSPPPTTTTPTTSPTTP
jgi:hypothetical protein